MTSSPPTTSGWTTTDRDGPVLTGPLLRYAAVLVLEGVTRPSTVGEIVAAIERLGVRVPELEGKWVSDALRCERRKGRLVRVGRNRYIGGRPLPERTRRRARRAIREARRTGLGDRRLW